MGINDVKKFLQEHLSDGLVTIAGSGLSCAEGLPGMSDLADYLKKTIPTVIEEKDRETWNKITIILGDVGLEEALIQNQPSEFLESLIRKYTVDLIAPLEGQVMAQVVSGQKKLGFSRLLSHLLKPPDGVHVVTTNYDRLIELSAEQIELGVDTMFLGNYFGQINEKKSRMSFCCDVVLKNRNVRYKYRERVNVYKPHGSLDWYKCDNISIRNARDLDLPRLIITPGLNKFRDGYESPFDLHREKANSAIDNAARFLIIGYGFNDDHLETHLKPRIREGLPTVLLTHTISDKAKELIRESDNFFAFEHGEKDGKKGTRMVLCKEKEFFPDISLWNLNEFISEVLEP